MDILISLIEQLIDPEKLVMAGGLFLVLLVVFIENGVFFGFFLPGDTLLITTGLFCATNKLEVPLHTLIISISLSAILGSLFGYFFGKKMGETLFTKKDTLIFKKKYIVTAEAFFTRYGGMALIMGRFLPIIRTFAPIFAGIVKFNINKFLFFNVSGALLWVISMVLGGYFLGTTFPDAEKNLEYIIFGIIFITWIPVIRTYLIERKRKSKEG